MKKSVLVLVLALLAATSTARAEVNVNVSVGVPAPRVVVAGPPAVLFSAPPLFVSPSRLGFYVGVDTPYDIIFSSDFYYLYYGNSWHRSHHHNGPWVEVPYRQLPPGIRRHRIEQIRSYRDREYRVYRDDRDHYRGRYFRAGEPRREEVRDERRHERQEIRDERRHGREEIRDERRQGREERRDDRQEREHGRRGRD